MRGLVRVRRSAASAGSRCGAAAGAVRAGAWGAAACAGAGGLPPDGSGEPASGAALDELIQTYETKVGPRNGARVIAKAWSDSAYYERLLKDATPAIAEFTPIMVEEMPRFSRMIDRSGRPRPMATPTALMAEIAAISEGQ